MTFEKSTFKADSKKTGIKCFFWKHFCDIHIGRRGEQNIPCKGVKISP